MSTDTGFRLTSLVTLCLTVYDMLLKLSCTVTINSTLSPGGIYNYRSNFNKYCVLFMSSYFNFQMNRILNIPSRGKSNQQCNLSELKFIEHHNMNRLDLKADGSGVQHVLTKCNMADVL